MQQLRQHQVKGQIGESLADDIRILNNTNKYFNEPVSTFSELPLSGNDDGDVRIVKDEFKAYVWNETTSTWSASADVYTKSIESPIVLSIDGQKEINTGIKVGNVGGIISIDTVKLIVNGTGQNSIKDYIVRIDSDFNCVIEWKSRDFQLEISDTITMSYDIIQLS